MQTIYYTTRSFIRHQGNLVDLGAYRQKLAAVSGGDWAQPEVEAEPLEVVEAAPVLTLVPPQSPALRRERARRRRLRQVGILLDFAASGAIIALVCSAVAAFARL